MEAPQGEMACPSLPEMTLTMPTKAFLQLSPDTAMLLVTFGTHPPLPFFPLSEILSPYKVTRSDIMMLNFHDVIWSYFNNSVSTLTLSYSTGNTAWRIWFSAWHTKLPEQQHTGLDSGPSHSCPSHTCTWVKTFNPYNTTVGINYQEKQKAGKQSLTSSQRTMSVHLTVRCEWIIPSIYRITSWQAIQVASIIAKGCKSIIHEYLNL